MSKSGTAEREARRYALLTELADRMHDVFISANRAFAAGHSAELARLKRLHDALRAEFEEIKDAK